LTFGGVQLELGMLNDPVLRATFWALLSSLLGVLSLATLLGVVLKRVVAHGAPHAVIDNLNSRNKAWWVMLLAGALAFVTGKAGVVLMCLGLSFMALREFITVVGRRPGDHAMLACAFYVVLPLQYLWVWLGLEWLVLLFVPLVGMTLLPIIWVASVPASGGLDHLARTQWGLMACVYGLSHLPALVDLPIAGFAGRQVLLAIYFLVVVQFGDVLQFMWGKLLGRHRVAPRLSPSKTVEGLCGGLISLLGVGWLLSSLTPFTPWQAAWVAFLIGLAGFFGALVMSAIKRACGTKDWGSAIEGHGGALDRIDSMVLTVPLFYHLLRVGWGD
jgi:phosphatidate cytidylyltransferase